METNFLFLTWLSKIRNQNNIAEIQKITLAFLYIKAESLP